jgi:acetolactate synthase regulatory subunit
MDRSGRELTVLQITAVASDSVLARVVVLLGAKGAVVRDLRCSAEPSGPVSIRARVETASDRAGRLALTLARLVDVVSVDVIGVALEPAVSCPSAQRVASCFV